MFTGLVQCRGTLHTVESDRFKLMVGDRHDKIWSDLEIGDSVAVDGVCLTVEEIADDGFIAAASPETLQRTTLGRRSQTTPTVNLETSLRVGSKLGGHFVTGHVDGLGCLQESLGTEDFWEMTFSAPPGLSEQWEQYIARYLISKGSIAVNGISLTVAECDELGTWFKVAVIPHTYEETNLAQLRLGDWVNLEGDILGKYVDKLLGYPLNSSPASEKLSLNFLAEHGYL